MDTSILGTAQRINMTSLAAYGDSPAQRGPLLAARLVSWGRSSPMNIEAP